MVNREHLYILEKGAETWNLWRRDILSSNIDPDLTNADLRNVNLTNANLKNTNLSNANLSNANLSNVQFGYF